MNASENAGIRGSSDKTLMPHKGGRTTTIILVVVLVALIVIAAAFATGMLSLGSEKGKVTLTGAGATFPMPLILKWADEYYNVTDGRV